MQKLSQNQRSIKGIVTLSEGSMAIAARTILPSLETEGPPNGILIMGRFLRESSLENLVENIQLQYYRYNDRELPPNLKATITQNSSINPISIRILDRQTLAGYRLLNDIFDRPALILQTTTERTVYNQGKSTITYYLWTTLGIGVLLYLLTSILLEKLILARLSFLTQEVSQIEKIGNWTGRVLVFGNDELSNLGRQIDQMLQRLQESQQALQESQERYDLAVEGSYDGIWDWNLRSNTIYFSPRWKAILGYENGEIGERLDEWFERVHPQEIEQLQWTIDRHLQGEIPHFTDEYRIQHKDGTYIWVLCRGLAIRDEGDRPYRMAGSLTDITELKRGEEKLLRQSIELARSNTELEKFAYIASHDLQEPLRKIESFGDRLMAKYSQQLPAQGRDYLERMQNSARRMRSLIQGLLTFSRITTQGQSFIPVDLNLIIEEVLSDLEIRLQETGACIELDRLLAIRADPLQMRQLFQNSIGNALKFCRSGEIPAICIRGQIVDDRHYQIAVSDNGIGFDEKYSDRIFQIFQRLHGRNEYEGTGIGLAICAKIVERHGGSIVAKSSPGQGATFIITFPIELVQI